MKKLSEKDKTLHAQFSRYGRNAREWMRKCVLLLPEIERNRVWEKKDFGSIYEYAAKLAGMSRETVNDSLRVFKKIEDKPLLMEIVEQKGINCIKPIVNLVNDSASEKFWAEKAKIMSKNTLQVYAKALRGDDGRAGPSEMLNFPHQEAISIQISFETKQKLEKLKGNKSWDDLFNQFLELHEEKVERLKKEADKKFAEMETRKNAKSAKSVKTSESAEIATVDKASSMSKSARSVPMKIGKYVITKTNHNCAFSRCTKPAEHLHHIERFAITHNHDPEKIIPLCKEHHELAHEGLIENEDVSPSEWRIRREADMIDYKFLIDQRVAAYRKLI